MSINFYLVLQTGKMWYSFFNNQFKKPLKNIFYPKSMNFISPQKFLLLTVCSVLYQIQCHVTYIISIVQHTWHQEGPNDVTDRCTRTPQTQHQTPAKTNREGVSSDGKYLGPAIVNTLNYHYQLLIINMHA